jgi:type I restriction enzyme S subunit
MNLWYDCEKKPITELLEFIVDNRGKTVPTTETGHILIATNCIKNDSLYPKYEKIRFLSQETYETFFRSHPLPGDIIFVNKGTPGRVCLVPEPVNFCIAQDMIALRANMKEVDNHYLFAVLRSPMIQAQIHNTYVGDVIPHFKKQFMDRLLIPIPSMAIQKKIGDIYYTLCDKIEVNRRINEQLEELAQALFKSWFVDFEPFKDGEFVESELGMIPEGWKVSTLGEYCKVKSGFAFKSSWWQDNGLKVIKIKNITSNGVLDMSDCSFVASENTLKAKDFKTNVGDLLIAMTGATIGKFCMISSEESMYVNQRVGKFFLGNNPIIKLPFIYCSLKTERIYSEIVNKGQGSAQPNISSNDIESIRIPLPMNMDFISLFNDKLKGVFEKMIHNQQEITHLTNLRDTLLPKLMSGEIDVNEVEI